MPNQYKFTFSEEFLLTATLRYRQQLSWLRTFHRVKWPLLFVFMAYATFTAVVVDYSLLILFVFMAGALFLGWPIDAWLLRRRFRKSPYHNDQILLSLSDEGLHVVGLTSEIRLSWPVFTKARRFSDGLLLFQGPSVFHWLPNNAVTDPSIVLEVEQLVRSWISDFRDI
jgi:hypothetical protein